MSNIEFLAERQAGPDESAINRVFVQQARAIAAVCASRMLLMIAVITGSGIWSYAAWAPTDGRLYVAIAYSVVFVGPLAALYWKRG